MSTTIRLTAEKGPIGIRILSSDLEDVVEGLEKIGEAGLRDIGREVGEGCTISATIRIAVEITHMIRATQPAD
ncbi:hypothetical protein [Pseudorhodoplanes sinuspersici]|uniref:hypothetical protein n=1 Tax=Pseudorhodoplanes sinuspersici TaxID=1235591 RepID=UPI0011C44463|nr:hypothetical protein [Pseudorhodoplanes sinuspersici]